MKIRAVSTLWLCLASAVLVPLMGARSASASTQYCFNGLNCSNTYNKKVGEDQMKLTISAFGNQVKMKFSNTGPKTSALTRIFFDDRNNRLGSYTMTDSGSGVDFSKNTSSSNLPNASYATPAFQSTLKFFANSPATTKGINPGEWLELCFNLKSGNLTNLLNDIKIRKLRIGLKVEGFKNGGWESFVNDCKPCGGDDCGNPIPLPSAAGMGLVGLGLVCGVRRRS